MAGQFLAGAVHGYAADLQHVRVLGRGQRDSGVLLHDQDCQSLLLVQGSDDPEELLDGGGREAERGLDRKSTRLNSSHIQKSRMPSSA